LKSIKTEIPGIGPVELREPSVAAAKPYLDLMTEDTQEFMYKMLDLVVYQDGLHVPDVTEKVGVSGYFELFPIMTELFGFGETEAGEKGND